MSTHKGHPDQSVDDVQSRPAANTYTGVKERPPSFSRADATELDHQPTRESRVSTQDLESKSVDPWIGAVIDERYEVLELLGEGGMGHVYLAEHLKLRKKVAVKVIHRDLAGIGEVATRFAREAAAAARLDHPHVAAALDYGTLPEGGAYLVMQLVRGENLQSRIERGGPFPWRTAVVIAAQVADALTAAHDAGVIHRDLKPDNIVLERRRSGKEFVKVLDFGIARLIEEESEGLQSSTPAKPLTRAGSVMGTPGYMAPEQAVGDTVDPRADLYALGVILWETITGRPLFDEEELAKIVSRQFSETPFLVSKASKDRSVPEELDLLVAHLLSPNPGDRPHSASEVRERLQRLTRESDSISASNEIEEGDSEQASTLQTRTLLETEAPQLPETTSGPNRSFHITTPMRAAMISMSEVAEQEPRNSRIVLGLVALGLAMVTTIALMMANIYGGPSSDEQATIALEVDRGVRQPNARQSSKRSKLSAGVNTRISTMLDSLKREQRKQAARWILSRQEEEVWSK
ncbi:MAG: serine/threonine-protein kinase [Myxococcota bacterium]